MGARAAVNVANDLQGTGLESFVLGVICLAYPLQSTGSSSSKLRDEPLKVMTKPVIFVSGNQDKMANKTLMTKSIECMHNKVVIHWIDKANHSQRVKGRTDQEVLEEVSDQVVQWCDIQIREVLTVGSCELPDAVVKDKSVSKKRRGDVKRTAGTLELQVSNETRKKCKQEKI